VIGFHSCWFSILIITYWFILVKFKHRIISTTICYILHVWVGRIVWHIHTQVSFIKFWNKLFLAIHLNIILYCWFLQFILRLRDLWLASIVYHEVLSIIKDIFLHKLHESLTVGFDINRRNLFWSCLFDIYLVVAFNFLLPVVFLQIINDAHMIDVLSTLALDSCTQFNTINVLSSNVTYLEHKVSSPI